MINIVQIFHKSYDFSDIFFIKKSLFFLKDRLGNDV